MSTSVKKPSMLKRIAKSAWSWATILIVGGICAYAFVKIKTSIDRIEYALTPPELPAYQKTSAENTHRLNPVGWPNKSSEEFHYTSQGTATIPIPYSWFVALEAPKKAPGFLIFGQEKLFVSEYMSRMGFIEQPKTKTNPDGLPIGIAKTPSIYFPGVDRKVTAAGFTCAACHTGQMVYDNNRYIIDGAPAMTDLGLFTSSLGAALAQTVVSGKVPLFKGRFSRFAKRVLGHDDNILSRKKLYEELVNMVSLLSTGQDTIAVTEGFTRLDALNRIGNQVFDKSLNRSTNYAAIDAPVNYPHIWTTSWFDWVQYDGSIMQPLVRNTGEALGVKAYVDTVGPDKQRFASSVNIPKLVGIEEWLSGTHPKSEGNGNKFNGLRAPKWPAAFPKVNQQLATQGKDLYQQYCQSCHLPTIDTEQFWGDDHWKKITYITKNNVVKQTDETYLNLNIIPHSVIGTDNAQAGVLTNRTVDTTGLNLNTDVCTPSKLIDSSLADVSGFTKGSSIPADSEALRYVPLEDSATSNFGLALGAFVERTNQQWFKQNYTPTKDQPILKGQRPNCLQAGKGYKARPLNGIWATAPFLHNGSVPTLYDLLSPLDKRPSFVQLGSQQFDPAHVGITQDAGLYKKLLSDKEDSHELTADYEEGLFVLDTRQPGNTNTGHIFDDREKSAFVSGIIGPKLSEAQKMALIEYLKTI